MPSGVSAATSSRSPPTARSATNVSAGPATSPSSRPAPASSSTPPASSTSGCSTSKPKLAPPMASCRSSCPDVLKHGHLPDDLEVDFTGPFAIWGDAAVWVPEALWDAYGDRDRLAAHYPAMVMHLDGIITKLSPTGLWDTGSQFGDWLDPDAPPENPGKAKADPGVVATACLYRSACFVAEAAAILDRPTRRSPLPRTRQHRPGSVQPPLRLCGRTDHLRLRDRLRPRDPLRTAGPRHHAGGRDRLAEIVQAVGPPDLHRLRRHALRHLGTQPDRPHSTTPTGSCCRPSAPRGCTPSPMGATTVWERWDSMHPDGSLNTGMMTSFNHYALGAVVDWLYQVVAGIQPAEPGYTAVRFAPAPGPGLDYAKAALDTAHGRIECGWRRDGEAITVDVLVPDGVRAELLTPDGRARTRPRRPRTPTSCRTQEGPMTELIAAASIPSTRTPPPPRRRGRARSGRHPRNPRPTPRLRRPLRRSGTARGRHEEREIPGPNGPVRVRIYRAIERPATTPPALVWMHGGAFMYNDLDVPEADHFARHMAHRTGTVVISIDYRLCDEHTHMPVPHDDCYAVYTWVRQNTDQLGIDPSPDLRRWRQRRSQPRRLRRPPRWRDRPAAHGRCCLPTRSCTRSCRPPAGNSETR